MCGATARLDLCADGQQAAGMLSEKTYDLIIADWELPGVDGRPAAWRAPAAAIAGLAVYPAEHPQ